MSGDAETLELPNGDVVGADDVFLYNGYPYRFVPLDDGEYAFLFRPLYWGDSELDVPFRDYQALSEQWGPGSEGLLNEAGWADWLADAREDDRFTAEEVAAIARELPVDEAPGGLLATLRRRLGI